MGIDGFTYADLYDPTRLRDLYDVFRGETAARDPDLWSRWEAYGAAPEKTAPIEQSDLLVRMAPHVSRFVATLFRVAAAADAIRTATESLDPLFRFKIDFVRKRALPLVKGGKHVPLDPADVSAVQALAAPWSHLDHELAIASAGCALLDREEAVRAGGTDEEKALVASQVNALKRWCAACLHDPGYRPWVIFRFPETLDYFNLVQV